MNAQQRALHMPKADFKRRYNELRTGNTKQHELTAMLAISYGTTETNIVNRINDLKL